MDSLAQHSQSDRSIKSVLEFLLQPLFAAGIEETWQIQQQQIVSAVEQGAARKAFDLALPDLGPYRCAYSRAGRHMVLGGTKGHLAVMEWQSGHLTCEVQVCSCDHCCTVLALGMAKGF
jgi:hypothetical protein